MTISRVAALASLGLALTIAACSDARDGSSLTGIRSTANHEGHNSQNLEAEIDHMIAAIYTPDLAANHGSWWSGIKRKVAVGDTRARQSLLDLVSVIQRSTSKVIPLAGQTREQTVAHLVLLMSLYVHGGPATPAPELSPNSDARLAVITPGQGQTVRTPSEQAGVIFPEGAVSTPTILVITKNEEHFEQECSGPLPTTRCQYPQFYKFDAFPDVRLNSPVTIAVCHVNHGDHRLARADHGRFRLAHQRPSDPAAYIEGGTIEGDIEILPLFTSESLVDCEENEYHHAAILPPDAGLFTRLASRTRWEAGRAARSVGRILTPKSLYAIDRGGGGTVRMFSDFNVIDPMSQADLRPDVAPEPASHTVLAGSSVTLGAWNIENIGTGPASASFTTRVIIATDTALSTGATTLNAHPHIMSLNPGALAARAAQPVIIPASLAPGQYFLGVVVDDSNKVAETLEGNNFASVRITVTNPAADYLISCAPLPGVSGDFTDRGFYVPSYPGTSLGAVELYMVSNSGGNYQFTLTARAGNYGGELLGTASASATLPEGVVQTPVTFDFDDVSVPEGALVTFRIDATPSMPFYVVQTTNASCPVIQTNGTTPPLDSFRRNGIAVRISGSSSVAP